MAIPVNNLRYSVAEYLRQEHEALDRHEYRNGEILLMAGGTADHSLITANAIREIGNRLKGKPCHVYESNLRVRTPRTVTYTYPDATIICGSRQFDQSDSSKGTVTNPRVIIEILSPSTEGEDRGSKFHAYQEIETFEEYVLIAQRSPRVEVFFRQPDGTWLLTPAVGLEAVAHLRSVGIDLPLTELYAGVEFPASPAPAAQA